MFGSVFSGIKKPYLGLDANTFDGILKQSGMGMTWQDLINASTSQNSLDKATLKKAFKDVPNHDFSKSGDQVSYQTSGENISVAALFGRITEVYPTLGKAELKQISGLTKDFEVKQYKLKTTMDTSDNTIDATVQLKMTNKKTDQTVNVTTKVNSQVEKTTQSVTEPAASQTESIMQLQEDLMKSSTSNV